MHVQLGQIMDNKVQKDQKSQLPLLRIRAQKQGVRSKSRVLRMPAALNTTKGVGRPPKLPLRPDPWTHPLPSPHIRNQFTPHTPHPPSGREQAREPVGCSRSPRCSRGPSKALPEFLAWPLSISIY